MYWHSPKKDKPPLNNEKVLLSVDGVNYVARFDGITSVFHVTNDHTAGTFHSSRENLYWKQFEDTELK